MRNTSFIDRSNKQAQEKRRWCENHPLSYFGEGYTKCVQGFKKNETCKEGKNE